MGEGSEEDDGGGRAAVRAGVRGVGAWSRWRGDWQPGQRAEPWARARWRMAWWSEMLGLVLSRSVLSSLLPRLLPRLVPPTANQEMREQLGQV